jgi:hypothetical protein
VALQDLTPFLLLIEGYKTPRPSKSRFRAVLIVGVPYVQDRLIFDGLIFDVILGVQEIFDAK